MADQSFAKKLQKRIVVYSAAGMILVGFVVALSGIVPLSVDLREAISTSTNTIALYLLDRRTNILVQCGQTIPPALWTVPDAAIQDTRLRGPVRVGAEYCMISGSTVRSSQGERLGYAMALYRLHSLKFVVDDYSDLGHTG